MTGAIRLALPFLSLVALVGASAELWISSEEAKKPPGFEQICKSYLCDDYSLALRAYNLQIAGDSTSLATATRYLAGNLSRNPSSPRRWADFCDVLAQSGSIAQARPCFDRALALGPASVDVLLSAGSFHLRYGDRNRGLQCLSQVLALTSVSDSVVFGNYSDPNLKTEDVLAGGLPPLPRPARSYLNFLMVDEEFAAARKTWDWMVSQHYSDRGIAASYSNFLVDHKMFADAAKVWASQPDSDPSFQVSQFVYNGDFEQELSKSQLDWFIQPHDHVKVSRDSQGYTGKNSLRIRFEGSGNTNYQHVRQKIVLPPGRYRLEAFVKTQDLTTDQGVYLRVVDGQEPQRLSVQTEALLGTADWRPVTAVVVVPAATRYVEFLVARRPSLKFDNEIKGDVWLDHVSLRPLR